MKYTCIIIDNEPLSHHVLKGHLDRIQDIQLINTFFNAKDARHYLLNHPVDILLLDIRMPEIDGIDFLRSLPVRPVCIISTAFSDYALKGFELGVIDFILKPIMFARFEIAIRRAIDFLNLVRANDSVDFKKRENAYEILIKTGTKKLLLDYRKIVFAKGLKDYTILQTEDKKFVVKGSIKTFEEYLPGDYFLRVHKSFIVAKPKIKVVYKNKIELDSILIPIGRRYKHSIDDLLNDHFV